MAEQSTKQCPYCGEQILAVAVKCRYCGSMLSDVPAGAPLDLTTAVKLALAARYEILEEAGRGGMAVVYKATQKNLGRTVALKVLQQHLVYDREFLDRFHREARESAHLSHPNIVTVYDEGIENGVHFIAMEYLDGTDLHTLIEQRGPLSGSEAKKIILPIVEALGYAHEAGLIHRDVKSGNIILIQKTNKPVLMDFGIAHAVAGTKLTQSGTVIGTPEYMSPEQADGKEVDSRTDIYSLGVVLYECLTGEVPFRGNNPLTVINKTLHEEPKRPGEIRGAIPTELENVVLRCLAKDPTQRYQTCEKMARALEGGERRSPIRQTSAARKGHPGPAKTVRWEGKEPKESTGRSGSSGVTWFLTAVIGVLVAILILMLLQNRESSVQNPAAVQQPTHVPQYTPPVSDQQPVVVNLGQQEAKKTEQVASAGKAGGQREEKQKRKDLAEQGRRREDKSDQRGAEAQTGRETEKQADEAAAQLLEKGSLLDQNIKTDDDAPPADFVAVEKEPVIIKRVEPEYPEFAMRSGLEGRVFVKIWVDKQGKVRQVVVLKSDLEIFNASAVEAAKKFVFTPAYMNNGPVAVWVSVPFRFRLADKK
jgi:TonB family protein